MVYLLRIDFPYLISLALDLTQCILHTVRIVLCDLMLDEVIVLPPSFTLLTRLFLGMHHTGNHEVTRTATVYIAQGLQFAESTHHTRTIEVMHSSNRLASSSCVSQCIELYSWSLLILHITCLFPPNCSFLLHAHFNSIEKSQ